jgi:nucleotide-binding universal stress UspA family protein
MEKIDKILCPVDFSEPSDAAVRTAVELAKRYSASILLAHAINEIDPAPSPSYTLDSHVMEQIPLLMGQMTDNAHRAMQVLINNQIESGMPADRRVLVGEPARSIVQLAEDEQVDLIVMATHGRSGIKGLFFGSVAEKVVRSAACPVLTIRERDRQ